MGRTARGWRLVIACWGLLWQDRRLVVFPAASLAFVCAAAAAIFGWAGGPAAIAGGRMHLGVVIWGAILAYPFTLVSVFSGVAFASQANARVEGRRASLREGVCVAWSRRRAIAWWALLSAGLGAVLDALSEIPGAPQLAQAASALLGAAWGVLTFFVVPVLALEERGPREAIGRSAQVFRARWGEQLTGGLVTGAIGTLLVTPGVIVLGGGLALFEAGAAAAIPVLAIAAALIAPAAILMSAADQLFAVVLYRHSAGRPLPSGFPAAEAEEAFVPRRRWWRDDA
jgi:hypothetical protein